MAKQQKKTKKPEEQPPIDSVPDESWEEIGDFWDSMHLFEVKDDVFEGVYLNSANNIGKNKSMVHVFQVGLDRIGIWGSALLDRRMEGVKPGLSTRIRYCGEEVSEKSGQTYRVYKVFQKKGSTPSPTSQEEDIPF